MIMINQHHNVDGEMMVYLPNLSTVNLKLGLLKCVCWV